MAILIAGIFLWVASHLFKRLLPDLRASLGNAGKGLVTVGTLAGLVLMIWGYRQAEVVNIWFPPSWTVGVNNLLMLAAVFFLGVGHSKGRLRARFRHPMLASVKIWAVAHLIVNGDLASIVLFGSMLAWAVVEVILINRAEPWVPKTPGNPKRDLVLVGITLGVYAAVSGIHIWLGVWPFGGGA